MGKIKEAENGYIAFINNGYIEQGYLLNLRHRQKEFL